MDSDCSPQLQQHDQQQQQQSIKKKSGMVVRSLLFPAYDSGANDAFTKQHTMPADDQHENERDAEYVKEKSQCSGVEDVQVLQHPNGYSANASNDSTLPLTLRDEEEETEVMHNHSPLSSRRKITRTVGPINNSSPITTSSPLYDEDGGSRSKCSTPTADASIKPGGVVNAKLSFAPRLPNLGSNDGKNSSTKETPSTTATDTVPISLSPRSLHKSNSISLSNVSKPCAASKESPKMLSSPLRRAKCWSLDTMGEAVAYKNVSPPLSPMNFNNFHVEHCPTDPSLISKSAKMSLMKQPLRECRSWEVQRTAEDSTSNETTTPKVFYSTFGLNKAMNLEGPKIKSRLTHDDKTSNNGTVTPGAAANHFRNTEFRKHVVNNRINMNVKNNQICFESPDVSRSNPTELMSPQRIEIEREDALDILSCLVDRSVAFHQRLDENGSKKEEESIPNEKTPKASNITNGLNTSKGIVGDSNSDDLQKYDSKILDLSFSSKPTEHFSLGMHVEETIELFRKLSETCDLDIESENVNSEGKNNQSKHEVRMKILDELQRCFKFAQEMERAALSASTWLNAIGRPSPQSIEANGTHSLEDPLIYSYSTTCSSEKKNDSHRDNCNESTSNIMITTMRAHLHDSQQKLEENERLIEQLNSELSNCRAEIGRLKSVPRSKHMSFASPNRSIFDEESECSSAANEELVALETALGEVENTDSTYSISSEEGDVETRLEKALNQNVETKREILLLKGSLFKAKKKIEILQNPGSEHVMTGILDSIAEKSNNVEKAEDSSSETGRTEPLYDGKPSNNERKSDGDSSIADISFLLDPALSKELKDYEESIRKSDLLTIQDLKSKIASSKLDKSNDISNRSSDENFITEWNEVSPLPPPPDHGLQSPIVNVILSQWTNDESMHNSLLDWMESILDKSSTSDDVLPLKISNLDHRVRDGFIMHVLPLLLRRPDIQVHVSSRAQRRTTYDIAVSISPNVSNSYAMLSPRQQPQLPNTMSIMAFQASRGNGIYEHFDERQMNKSTRQTALNALNAAEDVRIKVSGLFRGTVPIQRNPDSVKPETNYHPPKSPVSPYQSFMALNDDHSVASEKSKDGLIGAIGGAFGGLLNRRKGNKLSVSFDEADECHHSPQYSQNSRSKNSNAASSPRQGKYDPVEFKRVNSAPTGKSEEFYGLRYSRNGSSKLPPIPPSPERFPGKESKSSDAHSNLYDEDNMQYCPQDSSSIHRVVTAPPGRIGVTFVQYRGHAMVSEVSVDSPLAGRIFRSDILVAIDDVAVSGLPVREIVKIISCKSEFHRALRVVSSHDIQDFTQNPFHNELSDLSNI